MHAKGPDRSMALIWSQTQKIY